MKLYDILGVDPKASQADIKKAYRKLAAKHHPDKGGDEDKFKAIQKAYDILGNEEKRAHYDRTGDTGQQKQPGPEDILLMMFNQIVEAGNYCGNIVARIEDLIEEGLQKLRDQIDETYNRIDELKKLKGRIQRVDNGDNFFEMAVDASINRQEQKMGHLNKECDQLSDVRDLVETYFDSNPQKSEEDLEIEAAMKQRGIF